MHDDEWRLRALQADAIGDSAQDHRQGESLRALRAEVSILRELVAMLLEAQATGTRLALDQDPVASLLRNRLAGGAQRPGTGLVIGKVICPGCGSAVNDELGVQNERCVFCGQTVHTVR